MNFEFHTLFVNLYVGLVTTLILLFAAATRFALPFFWAALDNRAAVSLESVSHVYKRLWQ